MRLGRGRLAPPQHRPYMGKIVQYLKPVIVFIVCYELYTRFLRPRIFGS
jgi:hypothetical protein